VIHLDTSFLVRALVAHSPEASYLREWLGSGEPVRVSSIVWAEFLCGPVEEPDIALAAQVFQEPIPFTGEDATRAAKLFNLTGRRRGSLTDCMIAAIAVRSRAAMATSNPKDFQRFESAGLKMLTL
jgi:predicted nucleic acid-binding protein